MSGIAKKIAISLVLFVLLSGFFLPMRSATAPVNSAVSVKKGEISEFGGGVGFEARAPGFRAGIITGGQNSSPPLFYVLGKRYAASIENESGGRVTDRRFVTSDEAFTIRISRILEFRDINNNSRFDAICNGGGYELRGTDIPVRAVDLGGSWFGARMVAVRTLNATDMQVILSMHLTHPKVTAVWNDYAGRMEPCNGSTAADDISLSFVMTISYRHSRGRLSQLRYDGKRYLGASESEFSGTYAGISLEYSISLDHWKPQYTDSKIMLQTEISLTGKSDVGSALQVDTEHLFNITTARPRYMNISGDEVLSRNTILYGHSERAYFGTTRIGDVTGDRYALLNGENSTYRTDLIGDSEIKNNSQGYTGAMTVTGSTFRIANITSARFSASLSYFFPDDFSRTDASPFWISATAAFEAGIGGIAAVIISYRRYGHRN